MDPLLKIAIYAILERLLFAVVSTDGRNTLSSLQEMECLVISQRFHRGFTAAEKTELRIGGSVGSR